MIQSETSWLKIGIENTRKKNYKNTPKKTIYTSRQEEKMNIEKQKEKTKITLQLMLIKPLEKKRDQMKGKKRLNKKIGLKRKYFSKLSMSFKIDKSKSYIEILKKIYNRALKKITTLWLGTEIKNILGPLKTLKLTILI